MHRHTFSMVFIFMYGHSLQLHPFSGGAGMKVLSGARA